MRPRRFSIIAGAGSGKTNTLAHRVAHLIVIGRRSASDNVAHFLAPRRCRNAAAGRAHRGKVLGAKAGQWQMRSTGRERFMHRRAAAARVSLDIGLDQAFTIHDREDSADLMNLVRHDLGFSKTEKRFPMKGTCLAIYSRAVNAEAPLGEVLGERLPLVRRMGSGIAKAVRRLCRSEAEAERARLRRSAALLGADDGASRRLRRMSATASISADRRISGYEQLQASILLALQTERARADGRRRRRPVDLFFSCSDGAQHSRFPATLQRRKAEIITLERNYRSTQPILAAANAVIDLAAERFTKNLWSDRALGRASAARQCADDTAQAGYIVEASPRKSRGGHQR